MVSPLLIAALIAMLLLAIALHISP